jgi:hypothetical protein
MGSFQWFKELCGRGRRTLYAGFGGYAAMTATSSLISSALVAGSAAR